MCGSERGLREHNPSESGLTMMPSLPLLASSFCPQPLTAPLTCCPQPDAHSNSHPRPLLNSLLMVPSAATGRQPPTRTLFQPCAMDSDFLVPSLSGFEVCDSLVFGYRSCGSCFLFPSDLLVLLLHPLPPPKTLPPSLVLFPHPSTHLSDFSHNHLSYTWVSP